MAVSYTHLDVYKRQQQILFFKELGFPLREIKVILEKPDFDRIAAFKKQKELFLLKRGRLDRLIQLLERLEKGEQCMSFKEFDLSDYINALEDFKSNQTETVIQHWGSIENFDMFIQKIRDDEEHVAKLAIQQFGSIEKYTEEMKHNLEHFSEIMEKWYSQIPEGMRTEDKFLKLASHKGEDVASEQVQSIVEEIIASIPVSYTHLSTSFTFLILSCLYITFLRLRSLRKITNHHHFPGTFYSP